MNRFSNDVDVLRFEPSVFTGASFCGAVLCKGSSGQVNGTTFTAAGESFLSKQAEAGHVIYLSDGVGNIEGAYEIVSVDSSTQLTISVLRSDPSAQAIPVGSGSSLFYRIGTFDALAERIGFGITQMLGIQPGVADSELAVKNITDTEAMRDYSALTTLAAVFMKLYQNADTDKVYLSKNKHYQSLAEDAKRRTVVRLLRDDDRYYDKTLAGGHAWLLRK